MKLGYARVSTTDQDLAIQHDRLHEAGCEKLREIHQREEGKSISDVARTFNVHVATIYRCLHDKAVL